MKKYNNISVCVCVCLQGTLGEKGERGEPGDNGYQVSVSVFHTLKKKTFLFTN